jgi:hypothetical protein
MKRIKLTSIVKLALTVCIFALSAAAQGADQSSPDFKPDPGNQPKNLREMMVKMQIDEAKKQYDEMLDRSQQALKISEELEKSYSSNKQLSRSDLDKLDSLEKLVKKIRGELGGGGGADKGEEGADESDDSSPPTTQADAVKSLGSTIAKLNDELKKTSRFSVSVVAIESSNTVLKLVKFLKFGR